MESQKLSLREYVLYGSLGLFLLLSVILYVYEFRQFEQLLNTRLFLIITASIGALTGIGLSWKFQSEGSDLTDKVQIYVFFILISAIFMPLWLSIANRVLAFGSERMEKVEFWEQHAYYSSRGGLIKGEKPKPTGFYTFLFVDEAFIRLESKSALYPGKQRGDSVELYIKKGFLGMPYVLQKTN